MRNTRTRCPNRNIGALITRIGFWGPFCYKYNKETEASWQACRGPTLGKPGGPIRSGSCATQGAGDLVATAGRTEVGRAIAWTTSGRRASGGRTSHETTAGMTRAETSRGGSWVASVIFWNSSGVMVRITARTMVAASGCCSSIDRPR